MRLLVSALEDASKADSAVERILVDGPGGIAGKPRMLMLLGRKELALRELERLVAERDPLDVYIYVVPEFEPLWQEPGFQALLRRVGVPVSAPKP